MSTKTFINTEIKGIPSEEAEQPNFKQHVEEELAHKDVEALRRMPGEIEKSSEDIRTISFAQELIDGDLALSGRSTEALPLEAIHIVQQESIANGFAYAKANMITIPAASTPTERLNQFYFLLHEFRHIAAKKYFDATQFISSTLEVQKEIAKYGYALSRVEKLTQSRNGYGIVTQHRNLNRKKFILFNGLNEAVTEQMTIDTFKKNRDKIIQEFYGEDSAGYERDVATIEGEHGMYAPQRKVLNLIVDGVSEHYQEERERTWNRIKEGYYTGNLMHLRKIEKVFGKGTLRLLALMEDVEYPETIKLITDIFERKFDKNQTEEAARRIIDAKYFYPKGYKSLRRMQ